MGVVGRVARTHAHAHTHGAWAAQGAAGGWAGRRDGPRGPRGVEDSSSAAQLSFALSEPHAMSLKIPVSPDSCFHLVKGSFQVSVEKNRYSPIAFDISSMN